MMNIANGLCLSCYKISIPSFSLFEVTDLSGQIVIQTQLLTQQTRYQPRIRRERLRRLTPNAENPVYDLSFLNGREYYLLTIRRYVLDVRSLGNVIIYLNAQFSGDQM